MNPFIARQSAADTQQVAQGSCTTPENGKREKTASPSLTIAVGRLGSRFSGCGSATDL